MAIEKVGNEPNGIIIYMAATKKSEVNPMAAAKEHRVASCSLPDRKLK